jgi:DNA-binding HxlR family transcriptional regulator
MARGALCPRYHHAVELLGRRWTGAIISILLRGPALFLFFCCLFSVLS